MVQGPPKGSRELEKASQQATTPPEAWGWSEALSNSPAHVVSIPAEAQQLRRPSDFFVCSELGPMGLAAFPFLGHSGNGGAAPGDGCGLQAACWGSRGCLGPEQGPWGEVTLRPLSRRWPKQTASTCPQRSFWRDGSFSGRCPSPLWDPTGSTGLVPSHCLHPPTPCFQTNQFPLNLKGVCGVGGIHLSNAEG